MRHLCCYLWCQLVYGAPSLPGQGQRPSAPPTGRALTPFPCCRKGKTSKPRCALKKTIQPQLYCVGTTVSPANAAHLVPYKCSQIGRSYLLHLFFRMIREAVGLSKAHLGADAFYCHRREVRQPTPCCMRPSKQVVPFIERHTCNKLGWDR